MLIVTQQRRSTLEKPRTWLENSEVSYFPCLVRYSIVELLILTTNLGLAPLSETNRDRAAHLEMIKAMQG